MSRKLNTLFVMLLLLLIGCATHNVSQSIAIGDKTHYRLNALPKDWPSQSMLQLVTVSAEGNSQSLLLQSESDNGELRLAAISLQGFSLFSLTLMPDASFVVENHVPGLRIYPHHILAEMQLAIWPLETIRQSLVGATIRESQSGREILQDNHLIWNIEYGKDVITLRHITRNYIITIKEID